MFKVDHFLLVATLVATFICVCIEAYNFEEFLQKSMSEELNLRLVSMIVIPAVFRPNIQSILYIFL